MEVPGFQLAWGEVKMRASFRGLAFLIAVAALMTPRVEPALALDFQRAIEHCRDNIGLPIVQSCLYARGEGTEFEGCRANASPNVRACVQKTMIASRGRADVQRAIEHCRQTVGRPIVESCMRARSKSAQFEACRIEATPKVRACVHESMGAALGRGRFQKALDECRQSVGRPIVEACLGGERSSAESLERCRTRASPKVQACIQKRLRAA
jgi:hypothetical protein